MRNLKKIGKPLNKKALQNIQGGLAFVGCRQEGCADGYYCDIVDSICKRKNTI